MAGWLVALAVATHVGSSQLSAQGSARAVGTATLVAVAMPPLIGAPALLVGHDDRLVLLDYADMSVHWADATGRWLGTHSKVGGGPGEFREVAGFQFAPDGALWFSDGANSRVSVRSARDLSVIDEFRVEQPLRSLVPAPGAQTMLAIPASVQHMAVVVDRAGVQKRAIPFAEALASVNPIARERYLVRVSDSLSVVQFRWLDTRIGLTPRGDTRYATTGTAPPPEIVRMLLGNSGSVGYRIASNAREFAVAAGAQGDTLLVIRGSTDSLDHRRIIARYHATSGRLIDQVRIPRPAELIAATGRHVFVIGETDDGYGMFRVTWPSK
jgi:hypothetical protein